MPTTMFRTALLTLALSLGSAQAAVLAQTPDPTPSPTSSTEDTGTTIGGSGDNVAVAVNTKDGSSEFKLSFRIVRTSGDVVDQSNIAVAFASCEGCETVAIAMQVVLVSSDPSVVVPENYAIALNFECTSCATLASAYQFILGVDGNVHFSPEGNRALSEIRRALQRLRTSDLSILEIQAELDLLSAQLQTVLAEELISAGPPDVEVEETPDAGSTDVTPTPAEPTSTPTAEISPTASPSPSPTTDASPTSDPSPTSEPSPTSAESPDAAETPSPSPDVTAASP